MSIVVKRSPISSTAELLYLALMLHKIMRLPTQQPPNFNVFKMYRPTRLNNRIASLASNESNQT